MNELRKDYVIDRWVIVAEERGKRPEDFTFHEQKVQRVFCPFCPGFIDMPILYTAGGNPWQVAVIPNKFPATRISYPTKVEKEDLLVRKGATGFHEVIIETPEHDTDLHLLPEDHIYLYLKTIVERIKLHFRNQDIVYAAVFKNHGALAGESLAHPHTQIISMTETPKIIKEELNGYYIYREEHDGACIYEHIIELERSKKERFLFETEGYAVIAPFASVFPAETWIIPKRHMANIIEASDRELRELAHVLKKTLSTLMKIFPGAPYNFAFHNAPKATDFHFHIEIYPRLSRHAGFEIGFHTYINTLPPEKYALAFKKVIQQ